MAEIQFDEFVGDSLSSFWKQEAPQGTITLEVAGGQLHWNCPGPSFGLAAVYQDQINIAGEIDIYARFTLPRKPPDLGGGEYVGNWISFMGDNNGVDISLSWSTWTSPVGPFSLYIYWDSYNFLTGSEWNEGLVDLIDYVDPDFVTAYLRILSPGNGGFLRLFYATKEPFSDDDWTEITTGQVLSNVPDGDVKLRVDGSANAGQTPADLYQDYLRSWPPRGLAYDMLSDLNDIFYNTAEFAEEIIYTPRGESAKGIRAVVLNQDSPLEDPEVLGDNLRIRVRTSDIRDPGRDEIILYGRKYYVVRNAGGGPQIGEWELEISRSQQRVL